MVWYAMSGREEEPVEGAGGLAVPSGQEVTFVETVRSAQGPQGLTMRFRFLAPDIARDTGSIDAEEALEDMSFLCETYALPRVPETGPAPSQIIISLADRPVPFGEANPEATQFFEAFSIDGDTCVWEAF